MNLNQIESFTTTYFAPVVSLESWGIDSRIGKFGAPKHYVIFGIPNLSIVNSDMKISFKYNYTEIKDVILGKNSYPAIVFADDKQVEIGPTGFAVGWKSSTTRANCVPKEEKILGPSLEW